MVGSTPEFEEGRKATQFGGPRANPHSSELGVKPWSVQHNMRILAAVEIDLGSKDALKELSKGRRSIAYAGALKALSKMLQGDARFTEICLDRIDGKVEQTFSLKDFNAIKDAPTEVLMEKVKSFVDDQENK